MPTILLFALVCAAALLGLSARRLARRWHEGGEAPSVPEVLGQALSLAILFLAFVLVENAQAFGRARAAANAEADTVDEMFELAGYGPETFRHSVQGTLVCYARSIRHHEWSEAERGEFAPEVTVWSNRLRAPLGDLLQQDPSLFQVMVDADKERASQHQNRVLEACGTMPPVVYVLVGVTLLVSLAGFAASLPERNGRLHITALVVLSLLLSATVVVIRDLELPFSGIAKVDPVAMDLISKELEHETSADRLAPVLPCDASGRER